MCMSCGCGEPDNDHGDQRNITQNDLNNAAQAAGITPNQAAENIMASQPAMSSRTKGADVGQRSGQRIGDAGHIGPETPEIVAENVKKSQAAFSSGAKPADAGQTESPGSTGTGQAGTTA